MPRTPGPLDHRIAELVQRLGLVQRGQIDDALRALPASPGPDLAAVLHTRGLLSPDQAQSLREVAGVLAAGPSPPTAKPTDVTLPLATGEATGWGANPAELPSARYTPKAEIGRGGLGRVVEAVDQVFNRTVALKLLVADADPSLMDRFRYEAVITGGLDHPHIVAVHDMGVLAGSRDAFLAMKRIYGENLAKIIAQKTWPKRRLIEAFRDVCLAVAYAHSRGVVHRDLKPANVMLGEYGEVFVVDWGLARSRNLRAPSLPAAGEDEASPADLRLTRAGAVLGTPQYMSPEQALGRTDAIDERSDVYGLGAILYQVLCGRAPFDGKDFAAIRKKIVHDPPPAPSNFAPVDPQLEAICLKALEKDPKNRFPGARELANEVDAHLEGARDQERRIAIARGHLEDAERLMTEWRGVLEEWRVAREQKARASEGIGAKHGIEALRAGWALEDRLEGLARRGLELFHEADVKIGSALSVVPGHPPARKMRASLYWQRFLLSEEERDERGMLSARQVLEGVDDDGTWTAQLRGDGTLTLETFAYRCACLRQGRRVPDREFAVCGHDPWTGKRLRAGAAEGPTAQSLRDRLLNVHGEGCGRIESPGAEVWLFRDAEVDRVLVPSGEGAGGPGVPEVALPYLYPGSAVRPRGPGLFVGRTPIRDLKLPMSSGVLIVVATGRQPARVPFSVGRGEQVRISVTLFSPGETPDSACLVTPPSSRSGPLRSRVAPEAEAAVDGEYFVQRFPVTCGEYVEFLNALAAISPREALKRIPRAAESSDFYWQEDARGKVSVPGSGAEGKASEDDWRADWPVIGVSWGDAMAYARWKSERDGRLWCLPPESLWQRAAQGDDARPFPWGERRIAWFSHNLESAQGRQRPEPVGSRPFDESPFGVRDLAGNVSEWCLDEVAESAQPIRLARGGNWSASHLSVDCLTRLAGKEELVHPTIGFRICSPVAVTRAKAPVSGA